MTKLTRAAAVAATTALLAGATAAVAQTSSTAASKATASTSGTVPEGSRATVTVTLRKPATRDLRIDWWTRNGTAKARDYVPVGHRRLHFTKGQVAATVAVATRQDERVEPTEYFWVRFSGHGVKPGERKVKVWIVDDDTLTPSDGTSTVVTMSPAPSPGL
jgi:hypothetical protein